MNIIYAAVLLQFFFLHFSEVGSLPTSKLDRGKAAVTFQSIVRFCAQRNDTGLKRKSDRTKLNDVTVKLSNDSTSDQHYTAENSSTASNKSEEQNETTTRRDDANQRQISTVVMTTRDLEGNRNLTSGRSNSAEALMNRICPMLTKMEDPGIGSGGDVLEEIVDEMLMTMFWELNALLHKNRASAEGETYVNGKHYDLNQLMASCCSFG